MKHAELSAGGRPTVPTPPLIEIITIGILIIKGLRKRGVFMMGLHYRVEGLGCLEHGVCIYNFLYGVPMKSLAEELDMTTPSTN